MGDGATNWKALDYLQAKAADVYAWAKAAEKPTYQASEIQGLDAYIMGEVPIEGKADKVTGATDGNLAGLDANGNLTDSGKSAADFATAAQGAKADTALQSVKIAGVTLSGETTEVTVAQLIEALTGQYDASGAAAAAETAAKSYADEKIAALVGTAPETMDTLQELAAALQNNPDVVASLNEAVANKVDKVEGSRLMTDAEGTKLAGIAESATKVENSSTNGNILINGAETTVYTHPTAEVAAAALVKVGRDASGHVEIGAAVTKDDITALGIPAEDTGVTSAVGQGGISASIADRELTVTLDSVSTDILTNGTNTLVIDCGTASTVL